MPAQRKGEMLAEARQWVDRFRGCNGCRGHAIIVMGRQSRVRVNHVNGCPIRARVNAEHPMLYARDMGYVVAADAAIRDAMEHDENRFS
jgi:hypothetical protein